MDLCRRRHHLMAHRLDPHRMNRQHPKTAANRAGKMQQAAYR